MKPMTIQDIIDMHTDYFGVEPVITGLGAMCDPPIEDRILDAIEAGVPFVEDEVPDGTLS